NRRDWLFHFEERQPIAAQGHRRISVRVAGAKVTQFTTTIKIPDSVYREEAKETLLNVILVLVRFGAALLILALVIAGLVIAARARVGRAALVAAVTAVALMAIFHLAAAIVEQRFPQTMNIDGLHLPQSVALPLPALWEIGDGLLLAIAGAAAIGLFVVAIRSFGRTTWLPDVIGVALLFCFTIDSRVTPKELPSMIAGTLLAALLTWALVRFVLGRNLLA